MQQPPVLFSEIEAVNGKIIAFAELNAPKSLNALSLPMITLLTEQLTHWHHNDDIAVIVIKGAGEKAFCSGGDVVSLYHHLKDKSFPIDDEEIKYSKAIDFFQSEYQLDQLIHDYKKPILVWANGYVMGGGVGLMAGASHRVSTEKTLMAMPEVTIGLYPDVGASWFLNKMPNNIGLFLGLTGAMFNGADALQLELADYLINSQQQNSIFEKLLNINWQRDNKNHQLLDEVLTVVTLSKAEQPETLAFKHQAHIKEITKSENIVEIYHAIINANLSNAHLNTNMEESVDTKWLAKAQQKLKSGSPLSMAIIYQQLQLSKNYTLAQCFESELNLSLRCCQQSEFSEGVRALLVDKDNNPQWRFKNISDIDHKITDWFFKPLQITT